MTGFTPGGILAKFYPKSDTSLVRHISKTSRPLSTPVNKGNPCVVPSHLVVVYEDLLYEAEPEGAVPVQELFVGLT